MYFISAEAAQTRGTVMRLTAAAGGFVFFLLSMQGNAYLRLSCRTWYNVLGGAFHPTGTEKESKYTCSTFNV